ncbi:CLUMA_CG018343, isoform A [Clunio marinus]|uniref:CLUMA_CG018343, isoform A n=1 Tax=Clunio marinus TaxID=568069 RepID=A0A1J1IZ16_9DIPT|nr:CLUMA_CG018343, isoform A [Clunio marinus]
MNKSINMLLSLNRCYTSCTAIQREMLETCFDSSKPTDVECQKWDVIDNEQCNDNEDVRNGLNVRSVSLKRGSSIQMKLKLNRTIFVIKLWRWDQHQLGTKNPTKAT